MLNFFPNSRFSCKSQPFGLEAAAGQVSVVAVVVLVAEALHNCPMVE